MKVNFRAHLQLVGTVLLWGATWPAGRVVASNFPPVSGGAWRFVLAAVCMLLWMGLRRSDKRKYPQFNRRQWLLIALGGFSGVTLYAICFMYGLSVVQPGRASLFITLTPVTMTLLAAWWFKEPLNWKMMASILCAVLGAIIVISKGDLKDLLVSGLSWGEYVLLGCVLTWTLYSMLGKVTGHWGDNFGVTTYSIAVGGCMLLGVAWYVDGVTPAFPGSDGLQVVDNIQAFWFAFTFLIVGGTVLAYAWFFDAIAHVGAGTSASYVTLVPVFGVLFSWLLLDEPVNWSLLVGGALAVLGVMLMTRFKVQLLRQRTN